MELSINDIRELIGTPVGGHGFKVGEKYLFRTVTYHITGEIVRIDGDFLTLNTVAWIADSGRFADALRTCKFAEVEPMPDGVRLNVASITDASPITTLPTEQV